MKTHDLPTLRALALGALLVGAAACGDNPSSPIGQAGKGLDQLAKDNPTAQAAANAAAGVGETAAAAAAAATGGAGAATGDAPKTDEEVSEIAYAYSPIGKRDPFRSLFDQLRKEEGGQPVTELQTFEVDQLKLVAIVSRIATPYAMVEDPSGKGHTLTRGTLIGKNWGRVAEINPDCVVIKEEYRDYTGRKVTIKISVCLPKPEELKLD
jgi:type IV pilus assembly protein PilP